MLRWRLLFSALLIALALLFPWAEAHSLAPQRPAQARRDDQPQTGIHTRLTDEVEEWKIARTLQMVREMGAPWVVEYFPWAYIEPEKGRYDWGHADMVVDYAYAEGLTMVARVDYRSRLGAPATDYQPLPRPYPLQ